MTPPTAPAAAEEPVQKVCGRCKQPIAPTEASYFRTPTDSGAYFEHESHERCSATLAARVAAVEREREMIVGRIDEYLALGGFFNPEAMDHEKVRELLIDIRAALAAAPATGRDSRHVAPDDDGDTTQSDLREIVCRLWEDFEPRWTAWSQWWAINRHFWLHAYRAFGAWLPSEAARYPIRTPELFQLCPECVGTALVYTSPSPRDRTRTRMPSSA